jgi:hypothetical protein
VTRWDRKSWLVVGLVVAVLLIGPPDRAGEAAAWPFPFMAWADLCDSPSALITLA